MPRRARTSGWLRTKTLLTLLGGGDAGHSVPGASLPPPVGWRSVGRWRLWGWSAWRVRWLRTSLGKWLTGGFSRRVGRSERPSQGKPLAVGSSALRAVQWQRTHVASTGRLASGRGRSDWQVRNDAEELALLLALSDES